MWLIPGQLSIKAELQNAPPHSWILAEATSRNCQQMLPLVYTQSVLPILSCGVKLIPSSVIFFFQYNFFLRNSITRF